MKKILIIIAVILIAASAGIGIFIATFDIAPYKGLIISRLEHMTGGKAEIGSLSLKWKNGILLGIEDFRISREYGGNKLVMLSFARADALVEPVSLLMRKARIPSLDIYDGTLRLRNMTGNLASDIVIHKIEARVNDISADGPARFTARMAAASAGRNIALSGAAGGFASGLPFVRDCEVETDLAALDRNELEKAFPDLRKSGLGPGLAGALTVKIGELELSKGKVSKLSAGIELSSGRLIMAPLRAPVEKIELSASVEGSSVTVKSLSAELAGGSLALNGRSEDVFVSPKTALRAIVEVEGIKSFLSTALGREQNMDGNARVTFDGTMTGLSRPDISKTLAGSGEFYLQRGEMTNNNILNQTLGSLTLFPGLDDLVRQYVPAQIQQALTDNDTVIEPLRQSYTIENGYVMIPDLDLRTDTFDLRGEAKSSLTGDISGRGVIRFAQSVSEAMLKAAPEMKYITDSRGIVEFPLAFKIGDEGFKVIPDMKYIGTKVAVKTAGDAVAGFLQKTSGDEGSGGAPDKFPKLKDLIKGLQN